MRQTKITLTCSLLMHWGKYENKITRLKCLGGVFQVMLRDEDVPGPLVVLLYNLSSFLRSVARPGKPRKRIGTRYPRRDQCSQNIYSVEVSDSLLYLPDCDMKQSHHEVNMQTVSSTFQFPPGALETSGAIH